MIISLGRRLPDASSGLPGGLGEPPFRPPVSRLAGRRRLPIWPCSGWGLPSSRCRHRDWCALTAPFHPYPARGRGGLLSVALSVGSPPLAVSQHPALRSPDFPPRQPVRKNGRRGDHLLPFNASSMAWLASSSALTLPPRPTCSIDQRSSARHRERALS